MNAETYAETYEDENSTDNTQELQKKIECLQEKTQRTRRKIRSSGEF